MSLFNGPDENLPLLTQWLQVSRVSESDELKDFIGTEMQVLLEREYRKATGMPHGPDALKGPRGEMTPLRSSYPLSVGSIARYRKLHEISHRVMDALADDDLLPTDDLVWLSKEIREEERPKIRRRDFFAFEPAFPEWGQENDEYHPEGEIEPGHLVRARQVYYIETGGLYIDHPVWTEVLKELRATFEDRKVNSVSRCLECNFPFVAPTVRKIFCSRRCSARNGERRRRAERKTADISPIMQGNIIEVEPYFYQEK